MGVDEDKFWNMDLLEVERYIDAYNKRLLNKKKETASNIYNLGKMIGLGVWSIYSHKIKYPTLSQAFPDLFNSAEEEQMQQKINISRSVANFMNFANAHNKKMGVNING